MLTLWGNADSVNVQKITWACDELSVPVHRIDAGRHFGVVDTPAFRALNPNVLVPTIDDDGVVVWESGTILRYLNQVGLTKRSSTFACPLVQFYRVS